MRDIPKKVVSPGKTFVFESPESTEDSVRNLAIRNIHNGQTLVVQRGDSLELADALMEIANGIREAYNINNKEK